MCNTRILGVCILTLLCAVLVSNPPSAAEVPVGTAFAYQEQLEQGGLPVPPLELAGEEDFSSIDRQPAQPELVGPVPPSSVSAERMIFDHEPDHQVIIPDEDPPNSLAIAQGELYWAFEQSGLDCGLGGPDDGSKLSTAQAGGPPVTLLLGPDCGFAPFLVRTDGAHVYFAERVAGTINRIWVGADVDNPLASVDAEELATANGDIRDLEVDERDVWWVDDDGIKRIPKAGLRRGEEPFDYRASGDFSQPMRIAIAPYRNGRIYWMENVFGGEFIFVRSKTDAASEPTQLTGPLGNALVDLEVNSQRSAAAFSDDRFVYWTQDDGKVFFVRFDGVGSGIASNPLLEIVGLVVDDTHVFWAEKTGVAGSGRIRRSTRTGDNVTILTTGFNFERAFLAVDSSFVYFVSKHPLIDSIDRVQKDASVPPIDLAWWGMEVTQGIQDMANSVSLVRDKRTTVRAYPNSTTDRGVSVFAELHGTRGVLGQPGTPLPGTPLRHSPLTIPAGGAFERDSDTVYSWELPASWIDSGTVPVTLTVRLDPANSIIETNESSSSNSISTIVGFAAKAPLCGKFMPLRIAGDPDYLGASESNFFDIVDRFESLWPISRLLVFFDPIGFEKDGTPFDCNAKCGRRIIKAVRRRSRATPSPDVCKDLNARTHWIGMTNRTAGKGQNPGKASFVAMIEGNRRSPRHNRPRGGTIMAEELGHNRKLDHVDCGNPGSPTPDYPYCSDICTEPGFPTARGRCRAIDCDNAPGSHWGYDYISGKMIDPYTTSDFMSYCRNWVSDWTWEFLFDDLRPAAPALSATSSEERFSARAAAAGYDPEHRSADAESAGPVCGAGSCCDAAPGCDDPVCCEIVCACDPLFCCDGNWDQFCAQTGFEGNQCGAQLLCDSCFQQSNDILWLTGTVSATSNEGVITFGARVPNDLLNVEPGPSELPVITVTVEMIGSSGELLASHIADILDTDDHALNVLREFEVVVPYANGTARLRILKDGNLITERRVSPNPPAVSILTPHSGDSHVTELSVMFQGTDPENTVLHYLVQYSPNNGSRWSTLSIIPAAEGETVTMTYSIADNFLAGSESTTAPGSSRVRVIASDGVNTAIAVSEPFIVARRGPLANISSPRDGQVFHHNSQIVLSGHGLDPEDNNLDGSDLSWSVDGIGFVGSGRRVTLPGLAPGTYGITLTVNDSDANSTMQAVTIVVSDVALETSDCCEENGTPGCADATCQAVVCACDSFCCGADNGFWDEFCATTGFVPDCGAEVLCSDICTGTPSDVDGDGVPDSIDNCALLANPGQEDGDSDGAGDVCDNCISISNPDQAESDGDSEGDACDPNPASNDEENDPDSDGVFVDVDNCPEVKNTGQMDGDGDGVGDACDNCPSHANSGQFDCDDDDVGDACAIATGMSLDCNSNNIPDSCDLALGNSFDADGNDIPDECSGPCNSPCVWDIDLSGDVRVPDLIKLLSCWGPLTGDADCACLDIDTSGDIRVPDLIAMLAKWGVCSS